MGTILRTDIPIDEVARRHAAGESLKSLSLFYKASHHTLSDYLRRLGYPVRGRQEAWDIMMAARAAGPCALSPVQGQRQVRRRKLNIVRKWKEERGCQKCGIKHAAVLDLHHNNPSTKHHMLRRAHQSDGYRKTGQGGRGWTYMSLVAISRELPQCTVLCSNCHRILVSRLY
jgi:hypothetical protein